MEVVDAALFVDILQNEQVPLLSEFAQDSLISYHFMGIEGNRVIVLGVGDLDRITVRGYLNDLGRRELMKLIPFK